MDDTTEHLCTKIPFLVATTHWRNEPDGLFKNIHFVGAHIGFFLFNAINVACILIFHVILLKSWKRNRLVPLALVACFAQACSCLCSITRYAIDDEYGEWAHRSNWTSLIAYSAYNLVIWQVLLNRHRTDKKIWIGSLVWIGLALLTWYITRINWERDDFTWIRYLFALSTLHQLSAYASFWWEFRKGTIRLPEYFPASKDFVNGTMIVAMVLIVISLIVAKSSMIIFQFPATGMTFTVMVVVISMVGEIDFKAQAGGDSTSGEQQSLTA